MGRLYPQPPAAGGIGGTAPSLALGTHKGRACPGLCSRPPPRPPRGPAQARLRSSPGPVSSSSLPWSLPEGTGCEVRGPQPLGPHLPPWGSFTPPSAFPPMQVGAEGGHQGRRKTGCLDPIAPACEEPMYQSSDGETEAQQICDTQQAPFNPLTPALPGTHLSPEPTPGPASTPLWCTAPSPSTHAHTHAHTHTHTHTNGHCPTQSCPASTGPFLLKPLSFLALEAGSRPTWHSPANLLLSLANYSKYFRRVHTLQGQPGWGLTELRSQPIPFPPLAEEAAPASL